MRRSSRGGELGLRYSSAGGARVHGASLTWVITNFGCHKLMRDTEIQQVNLNVI